MVERVSKRVATLATDFNRLVGGVNIGLHVTVLWCVLPLFQQVWDAR